MINLTPISITATEQEYCASVTENLCQPFCLAQSVQPVANIAYNVAAINVVNGIAYCTIQANGSIMYEPKGCYCNCRPQTKMFTETFDVAFVGAGIPTIAIAYANGINAPSNVKCNGNAYAYNIVGSVTITATFPT